MSSSYQGFAVLYETAEGEHVSVGAGVSVKVRALGGGSDLTTLTTDADGNIAGGTVSPAAGTVVHFRVENFQGMAFSVSQTTT